MTMKSKIKTRLIVPLIILAGSSMIGGCMNIYARSFVVSEGGKYSDIRNSLPAISQGNGRLFLYMNRALGPAGVMGGCTIDGVHYGFASGTFTYIDLPGGKHVISTRAKNAFSDAQNELTFEIAPTQNQFLRMEYSGTSLATNFISYHAVVVSPSDAEREIGDLKLNTKAEAVITDGPQSEPH